MYQPVNGAGGSGTCANKAGGSSGRREGLWKNSHGAEEPLRKGVVRFWDKVIDCQEGRVHADSRAGQGSPGHIRKFRSVHRGGWALMELNILTLRRG